MTTPHDKPQGFDEEAALREADRLVETSMRETFRNAIERTCYKAGVLGGARWQHSQAGDVSGLIKALENAAIRLEILTGRMRGCNEETGKHELLDEAEMFCSEAREALSNYRGGK